MQGKSDLIRVKHKPLFFVLFILILAIATPVLADYLGPNRTVTETTSVCKVVLYECKYVAAKDQWKYKHVDDWSCSNEGIPWQAYDNYDGDCGLFSDGRAQWSKVETLQTVTTTHPEAMIISALQGCNLNNGWCNTASELSLNGTEPLSGYAILAVEGSLNGQTFACSGDNCAVPLNEGNNDFTFWALSSWGDSSQLETLSAKVDTIPPTRGLDIVATSGANDWYVSPTSLTATGSDATSGLSSVFLSIDSGTWQSSTILNEGVYNIVVQAEDNAGNISSSSTIISVDTTTPTIDVSVNGTTGNNGWYSSSMQVSATANDATSGVALFESSLDVGVYQAYNSPVSFADGYHTVQFRVVDKAGNETETPVQELYVDTIAPAIDLPLEWEVNDTITYKIQDDGSGLSALRIVIEDEDEKFAKVAWDEVVSGNKFKGEITWNGKFKDGTLAPSGEYLVWVKVTDVAGNERIGLGRVIVPSSFSLFPTSKSATDIPTPPADLFDLEDSPPTTATLNTAFGGSTTPSNSTSVHSLTLSSGTASASTTTSTNVLWGATAAALIGWATATALEERKKRREQEQAQAAQVQTQVDTFNAAQSAKRITQTQQWKINSWLEGQDKLNGIIKELEKLDPENPKIDDIRKEVAEKGLDAAIASAGKEYQSVYTAKQLQEAARQQALDAFRTAERNDAAATAWQQQQAEEKKAQDLQDGLAAYYAATRQGEQTGAPKVNSALVPEKKSWWQKSLDWIDNHQAEIALGVGIVVGVGVIILSGGTATSLVAAAWIAGAAVVAGGTVALGTIGLNSYYGRAWNENVGRNLAISAVAAAVVTGAGLLLTGNTLLRVGNGVAGYCATNPEVCARADVVLKTLDKVEEAGLIIKGAVQTARGDSMGAAETHQELQLEYLDGGAPGNTVAIEFAEQLAELGDDATKLIATYGDDVIPVLLTHGNEGIHLIQEFGLPAVKLLNVVDPFSADRILRTLGNAEPKAPYDGFSLQESEFVYNSIMNPNTKDSCHFASLCGNVINNFPLYPNELGQLDTNPNFKLIGDLNNNLSLSDLREGDLLTYYIDDGTMDGGRVLHSDRIFLINGSKIIVFDKPNRGAPYSFLDLSIVIDNPNFNWSNILVYRK